MNSSPDCFAHGTPEQVALTKKWVETWRRAGPELEKIRREEVRNLDAFKTISLLCGPADYTVPPRALKPTSGLIEQQFWFMKVACRELQRRRRDAGA
jgi:hypothetical protein